MLQMRIFYWGGDILFQGGGLTNEQKNDLIKKRIRLCCVNPTFLVIAVLEGLVNIDPKDRQVTIPDSDCPNFQPKLSRPKPPVLRNSGTPRHRTTEPIIYTPPTSDDEYLGYGANLPDPYGF